MNWNYPNQYVTPSWSPYHQQNQFDNHLDPTFTGNWQPRCSPRFENISHPEKITNYKKPIHNQVKSLLSPPWCQNIPIHSLFQ